MTLQSAASLPANGSEAGSSAFRSLRRHGPAPVCSLTTAEAPRRHFPAVALATNPPRGRILVVADQPSLAFEIQRPLRDAGFVAVGPAGSAAEAGRLIARGPIDGAVLDQDLAGGADAIIEQLRDAGIPFVLLTGGPIDATDTPSVSKPIAGPQLIRTLERALLRRPAKGFYPVPPPQPVWPRVFPQA